MEENRKKREKEDPSEKKKLCFCHFWCEKCAKESSKTRFFYQHFLSIGRATTRRVKITRGHMKR